jgi:hypothetical protein
MNSKFTITSPEVIAILDEGWRSNIKTYEINGVQSSFGSPLLEFTPEIIQQLKEFPSG